MQLGVSPDDLDRSAYVLAGSVQQIVNYLGWPINYRAPPSAASRSVMRWVRQMSQCGQNGSTGPA
jgi:hypothetical protein